MRESLLLTDYELKRLDDEIKYLQIKRDRIAKQRLDGADEILKCLPACTFDLRYSTVIINPAGFLKKIIPAYISPQEEYVFPLNAHWQLNVNDYGCVLKHVKGRVSLKETLAFLRKIGVDKKAIKVGDTMDSYYEKELSEAQRKKTALVKAIEETW